MEETNTDVSAPGAETQPVEPADDTGGFLCPTLIKMRAGQEI